MVILLGVISWGIAWFLMLFSPLIEMANRKKNRAMLQGSALKVGPDQFGQLHESAQVIAGRLGLEKTPEIYIIESNTLNAAGRRSVAAVSCC